MLSGLTSGNILSLLVLLGWTEWKFFCRKGVVGSMGVVMTCAGKASPLPSAGAFRIVRSVVLVGLVLFESKLSRILNNVILTGRVCANHVPLGLVPTTSLGRYSLVKFRDFSPREMEK